MRSESMLPYPHEKTQFPHLKGGSLFICGFTMVDERSDPRSTALRILSRVSTPHKHIAVNERIRFQKDLVPLG